MAYNFLGLVNEINSAVNEAGLTSDTFLSATTGHYSNVKNAVNRAIDDINLAEKFWRFNYVRASETLVADQARYSLPTNSRIIDFDSFVLPKDTTFNTTTSKLPIFDYDEYVEKNINYEYDSTLNQKPKYVVKGPGEEYILFPTPDKAYTLHFDYFIKPALLTNPEDVPTIPEDYRLAIFYGALGEIFDFRDDEQKAEKMWAKRDKIIKDYMRPHEINRQFYVRSNMIERDVTGNSGTAGYLGS